MYICMRIRLQTITVSIPKEDKSIQCMVMTYLENCTLIEQPKNGCLHNGSQAYDVSIKMDMPSMLTILISRYTETYGKDSTGIDVSEHLRIPDTHGTETQYYSLSGFIQHKSENRNKGHYESVIVTKTGYKQISDEEVINVILVIMFRGYSPLNYSLKKRSYIACFIVIGQGLRW